MKNKKWIAFKNKKWFTLIEMLIVIVIIGILAAAIIPRLNSARGRANDVARKADLNQVATALITYQLDMGRFPWTEWWDSTWTTIDKITNQLVAWWMTSIPKDPANNSRFSWSNQLTDPNTPFNWYYIYQTIKKSWIPNWWFVLMARMESHWQSNYVICNSNEIINIDDDYVDIHLCSTIEKTSSCQAASSWANWSQCKYIDASSLRYIYKY